MPVPKIMIADSDLNYITPIQLKFIEEFFDKVQLELVTDEEYFDEYFSHPRTLDILIVSEEFYDYTLSKHNIGQIFLMTEEQNEDMTAELTVNRIYKYTSIKEIFNEITGKSSDILNVTGNTKKETEIILVYSATGGSGKTTVAMGISACLTKNYKRVLYLNASRIHTFQRLLENSSSISSSEVYAEIAQENEEIYEEVKHVIRKERFYYLPPFKNAMISLGIPFSVYEKLAVKAKKSGDYDYIVIDGDDTYDEDMVRIINAASRVIVVTEQTEASVYATNILISNLNGINSGKYLFVCNNFDKLNDNALISPDIKPKFTVSEYVDHIEHYDSIRVTDLERNIGIQKTAFLII